jgi:hypothetical protein
MAQRKRACAVVTATDPGSSLPRDIPNINTAQAISRAVVHQLPRNANAAAARLKTPLRGENVVAVLNADWRVVVASEPPPQWVLLRRKGPRWIPKAYCTERDALIRNVVERVLRKPAACGHPEQIARMFANLRAHGGKIDTTALDVLRALPTHIRDKQP